MDQEFYSKIRETIENNEQLKNSFVLKAVLEGVTYQNDTQYLTELQKGLSEVNEHLSSEDLAQIIAAIGKKLSEPSEMTDDQFMDKMSNEYDTDKTCDDVCDQMCKAEPELCTNLKNLKDDKEKSGRPSYMYLQPAMNMLADKKEYNCVKESYDAIKSYMDNNQEKLTMVDAYNYFKGGEKYNPVNIKVNKVIVECLREGMYNPDIISMRMGEYAKSAEVSSLLDSLRSIRATKAKDGVFDLSESKGDTNVYNYVGPILRENHSVTLYADGSFIKITPEVMKGDDVKSVVLEGIDCGNGKSVNVYELTDISVFNKDEKYYNATKAFEALSFHPVNGGVVSDLKRSNIGFMVNENQSIDFTINGRVMKTISEAKNSDLFVFENTAAKSCIFNLVENAGYICSFPSLKFVCNENLGKYSMVLNLGKDYIMYNFVNEGKTEVYRLDAYKLYEYCVNEYGFDISPVFGNAVESATNTLTKIEEKKREILGMIDTYKNSIARIDEVKKSDIKDEDRKELDDLTKTLFEGINKLQNNYTELCKSADRIHYSKNDAINEGEDGDAQIEAAEIPQEEVPQQETPEEEIPQEEIPQEEVQEQEIPQEDVQEEEVPQQDVEEQDEIQGEELDAQPVQSEEIEPESLEETLEEGDEEIFSDDEGENSDSDENLEEGANDTIPADSSINEYDPEGDEIHGGAVYDGPSGEQSDDLGNDPIGDNLSGPARDAAQADMNADMQGYDDTTLSSDFMPNFSYEGFEIEVAPDQKTAKIRTEDGQMRTVSIGIATVDGKSGMYVDPEGFRIPFDEMQEIATANESLVNEGLGNIIDAFKVGLFKNHRLNKSFEEFGKKLTEIKMKKLKLNLEVTIAKKSKQEEEIGDIKQRINDLNERENLVRKKLDSFVSELKKKKPNAANVIDRKVAEFKENILSTLGDQMEQWSHDEKYQEAALEIKTMMAKISNAKAKLNTETDQIAKDSNNTFEKGDVVVSKDDENKKLTVINIDPAAADDSPVVLKDQDGFTVRMTLSDLTNKFTKSDADGGK